MQYVKGIKFFMLFSTCIFLLGACGASNQTSQVNDGVQDIQPGDESIIQPPTMQNGASRSTLEERNL